MPFFSSRDSPPSKSHQDAEVVTQLLPESFVQTREGKQAFFQGDLSMHEQPAPPYFMVPKRLIHEPIVRVCLCLFIAFICGLALGFLQVRGQGTIHDPWLNGPWTVPLWFPFVLGIVASVLTVRVLRRAFWLSVAVGLLTWIGMTFWWFPIAYSEDAAFSAYCLQNYCHGYLSETFVLLLYTLLGMLLVLLGTLVIRWTIRAHRYDSGNHEQ